MGNQIAVCLPHGVIVKVRVTTVGGGDNACYPYMFGCLKHGERFV